MNVQFLNELQVAELDDENWQLLTPFCGDAGGHIITVPAGFKTDFASVPRIGAIYAVLGNRAHRAAVLHDWLYSVGGSETDREYADLVLRYGCEADGMDQLQAFNMWLGVRAGGRSHWTYTDGRAAV